MTNPLHAEYYADNAIQQRVSVIENVQVADQTFRCRFRCPEMARKFLPGQFLMVRMTEGDDPLIGRPFALYDVTEEGGEPSDIDFVYLVEGKMTSCLQHVKAGAQLEVWGPLGNGFVPSPCKHLIMVAGGIGQTPFLGVAKERLGVQSFGTGSTSERPSHGVEKISLCYGARTADRLAGLDDFEAAGIELHIATDDGSRGHSGLVTDLLRGLLDSESNKGDVRILCCGPEPMMEAVSQIAAEQGVACEVSLEEPMACGIGICFTCVAKICDDSGEWDYKRTCVAGPVFDSAKVEW